MALDKLTIVAYPDDTYSGSGDQECSVMINPASYTHNHQIKYDNSTAQGSPGTTLKFKGIPPETISFDIYFDATGAVDGNSVEVKTQLDEFKEVCFDYNGTIHEPNYLVISWGSLVFKCKLTSLDVNYTLFKPDGTPLRAKAGVKFEEALDSSVIAAEAGSESPDLTHHVLVREGDTLPLLCKKAYGDPSYYMEVARYNKLVNFRNLVPGTELYLPPIK